MVPRGCECAAKVKNQWGKPWSSFQLNVAQNIQFSSVTQSCMTLCDPMNCSTPGFPVHQLPELAQAHVHQVGDGIQSSHPMFSPSPAFNLSQSFPTSVSFPVSQFSASGGQSIGVSASASVLPMDIQDWFPLGLTGLITLLSKGLSRVFSNTTVQKKHYFGAQLSLWSNSHIYTWLLEKQQLWLYGHLSVTSLLLSRLLGLS